MKYAIMYAASHSQRGMKILHKNTFRLENSILQTNQKNRTSDSSRIISIPTFYKCNFTKKQKSRLPRRVCGWEYYLVKSQLLAEKRYQYFLRECFLSNVKGSTLSMLMQRNYYSEVNKDIPFYNDSITSAVLNKEATSFTSSAKYSLNNNLCLKNHDLK